SLPIFIARARPWHRPVVVHPQFTEPDVALRAAGHRVTHVVCRAEDEFALDPARVPDDADLVIVGNPTNPTGRLHPAAVLRSLCRRGRVDRKSTRLNSSHVKISYAVFCLKKKNKT